MIFTLYTLSKSIPLKFICYINTFYGKIKFIRGNTV